MRILIAALGLAVLTGCTSNAISLQQSELAPKDELYAFQSKPSGVSGKLTVLRDSGLLGSGCDIVVWVDGQRAAKLGVGQRASFYLPPGQPNIGVGLAGSGLCVGAATRTITGAVQADRESIYRVSSDMNGFYIGPYLEYK